MFHYWADNQSVSFISITMQDGDFTLQEVSELTQFINTVLVHVPAADGAKVVEQRSELDPEGNTFTSVSFRFTVFSVWALED